MRWISRSSARVQQYWSADLFPSIPSPAARSAWYWPALLLLLVISWSLLFPKLSYPLLEPDEGRYAEIAREMLDSGDWISPTLYFRPYCDKPPLFYWLVAASFRIFGISEQAARFVPASAALLTVLATFVFGTRAMGIRIGFTGALILVLGGGFVNLGRVLILDGVLTLTVALSLFSAYESLRGSFRWAWWLASASFCALGVLAKGPVAFALLLPPVVLHGWLTRSTIRPAWYQWLIYMTAVIGVASPWFIAIALRTPGYASHFLWRHHMLRFFSAEFHPQPFWFYIPVLCIGCLPWSLLFVPLTRYILSRKPAVCSHRTQSLGFFCLWAAWCVLFFSLSRGKLPPYVMPALPAIGLVMACQLDALLWCPSASNSLRAVTRIPHIVLGVLCVAAIAFDPAMIVCGAIDHRIVTIHSVIWVTAGLLLLCWGRRLAARPAWMLCFLCAFLVNLNAAHRLLPAWAASHSPLTHATQTKALLRDDQIAIGCYGREWGSIAFHAGRRSILNFSTASHSELTEFLQAHNRTLLFLKPTADLEWFRKALPDGWEMRQIETMGTAIVGLVQRTALGPVAAIERDSSPIDMPLALNRPDEP